MIAPRLGVGGGLSIYEKAGHPLVILIIGRKKTVPEPRYIDEAIHTSA
jgi:hypothetical protein